MNDMNEVSMHPPPSRDICGLEDSDPPEGVRRGLRGGQSLLLKLLYIDRSVMSIASHCSFCL